MSEGGVTAVEEALRLRPTWINGGGDLPGPGGSVIAAMLAVAGGLCRHVLCFRTVWESTYAALGLRRRRRRARVSGPCMEWRVPFGAMSAANWIGMNANQYLHRYGATARDARLDRAQRARQRGAQPGGDLPRPDDDGRLPVGASDHHAVRALRLRRAVRRVDRRRRVRRVGRRRPPEAGDPDRRGRHPDHRADLVGPGHRSPTSRRCSASPPTSGPAPTCARPTSTSPSSTTASRSTPSRGSRRSASAASARRKDWLDGGRRIALDGDLPVNPHGGQLSEGRTHGFGFLYEAITQLRHDAGERQVAGRPHRGGHVGRRHAVGRALAARAGV